MVCCRTRDLPQANQRLKEPATSEKNNGSLMRLMLSIASIYWLTDLSLMPREFAEDGKLAAVVVVGPRQAVHRGRLQWRRAIAVHVREGHEDLERLVFHGLAA